MNRDDDTRQPGDSPAGLSIGESWPEWFDRHSRTIFIAPAVTLILIFAIFPTFYSVLFALTPKASATVAHAVRLPSASWIRTVTAGAIVAPTVVPVG